MGKSTSLPLIAVTGAERPYLYDLPNVLSLPAGLEFRFRYRAKWISEALREQIDSGERLVGRKLHLYFHSTDTARFLPLRECEVVALERLGPVYFLRFRVHGFASIPNLQSTADARTDRDDEQCSDSSQPKSECKVCQTSLGMVQDTATIFPTGVNFSKSLPDGSYLFEAPEGHKAPKWTSSDTKPEEASQAWHEVASIISHCEPGLRGIPLFYLLGFQNDRDAWVRPRRPWRPKLKLPAAFTLINGQRYRFRLVEWRSKVPAKGTMKLDCVYSSTLLEQEGASALVVGKYDVPEFTFRARSVGSGEVAAATHPMDPTSEVEGWPTYYAARVPIRVRRNRLTVTSLTALTAAGIALYALPEAKWVEGLDKGTWRVLLQFAGLILMFFGSGALVGRFAQMGTGVTKIPPSLGGRDVGSGVQP